MADSTNEERKLGELRAGLQSRILDAAPRLGDGKMTVDDLWRSIKACLLKAHWSEHLETPQELIHQYVPRPRETSDGIFTIEGGLVDGKKPFDRNPEDGRLKRNDHAWLHFTLSVRCDEKRLVKELWAYDFELVFPPEHHPAFVRFDLNEPGHSNEAREIRSHLHPANDDLLLPAPVMTPDELLDVMLRRLRHTRNPAHPRT